MVNIGSLSRRIRVKMDEALSRSLAKQPLRLPAGRYVSLCFDDFPKSAAETAAPMIEQLGWRATWYVSGGYLGKSHQHFGAMFDVADLFRLIRAGHDIGCHTFDHIDCARTDPADMLVQCARNQAFLQTFGVAEIQSLAFPFGAHDLTAKKALARSDLALRGIDPGLNRTVVDLSLLKACGLQDDQNGLSRARRALGTLSRSDGWQIIFTHDVRDNPSAWGVTPDAYSDLLHAIRASGAEVVTVGEMVRRIRALPENACAKAA